ncbi:MAG: hypothetical protein GF417_13020 [Candidatus Latescibacteria bacterium]|nr:hypothetical protein [Candidatus Latescibacterota bacterium]
MTIIKQKFAYILLTIFSAIICFLLSIFALDTNQIVKERIDDAILIPSDSITIGVSRNLVEKELGKPYEKSNDDSTYLYYRKLPKLKRDQIVIIKFENDVVSMFDTNIDINQHNNSSPEQ